MDQLRSLIQNLDPQQQSRADGCALTPAEAQLYTEIRKNLPPSTRRSESHEYKLGSVVSKKLLDHLFPEPMDSVRWLKGKGLYKHFSHRMLSLGREMEKRGNAPSLREFYLRCFHESLDVPFRFLDFKLAKELGIAYAMYSGDKANKETEYVKYHLLFAECNRAAAKKDPLRSFPYEASALAAEAEMLADKKYYGALFYLYRTLTSYYTFMETDQEKMMHYLELSIETEPEVKSYFTRDMGNSLRMQKADAILRSGNHPSAYSLYKKLFTETVFENIYGAHYHAEQYAMAALCCDETEESMRIAQSYFPDTLESEKDILFTRGALLKTKILLHRGTISEATKYLKHAAVANEKTHYLPFNVQIRVLETLLFILKGDEEFALNLCTKNLKFLQSQRERKNLEPYRLFWNALAHLIGARFKNKMFSEDDVEQLLYFQQQFKNFYCSLPEKALESLRKK